MKILLIDADSTIPNIALCKLSSYYKSNNYEVNFLKLEMPYYPNRKKKYFYIDTEEYDKVFCSIVFSGNKDYIIGDGIIFGGTGYDLVTKLPQDIEKIDLDYSIYPDNKMSYGFITRGCIRDCSFCIVREKEGYIHKVNNISNITKHKKVKFLDNNILAYEKHSEILQELIDINLKCCFNQGLDIRLLNENNSNLLSKLNYLGEYVFAFDNISIKNLILNKLKLTNWRKDWQFKFFVYVNPDMPIKETVDRIETLRELKCLPYIMRDLSCWSDENKDFYTDIAAYCNQPCFFKKITFEVFLNKRHKNKKRIEFSKKIWQSNVNSLLMNKGIRL